MKLFLTTMMFLTVCRISGAFQLTLIALDAWEDEQANSDDGNLENWVLVGPEEGQQPEESGCSMGSEGSGSSGGSGGSEEEEEWRGSSKFIIRV